jgi:hypothetical protein
MGYTTDRTWVNGELPTDTIFNTYLRDNMKWLSTDAPCCRCRKTTAFSHNSSGNYLAITFDANRFDNASLHSTSSNTERIVVPTGGAGKFDIGGCLEFAANATGARYGGIGLSGIATLLSRFGWIAGNASYGAALNPTAVWSAAVADYFTLAAWQDSGGTLNVNATGNYTPEFWAVWQRN